MKSVEKIKKEKVNRWWVYIIVIPLILLALLGGFLLVFHYSHQKITLKVSIYSENIDDNNFSLNKKYSKVINNYRVAKSGFRYDTPKFNGLLFDESNEKNLLAFENINKDNYEVKIYYKRKKVSLTFNRESGSITINTKYGTPIAKVLKDKSLKQEGYLIDKVISTNTNQPLSGDYLVLASEKFNLKYVGKDEITYRISFYLRDLVGDNYSKIHEYKRKGATGNMVMLNVNQLLIPHYAILDNNIHRSNVLSAQIKYNGKTELKVYLLRRQIKYISAIKKQCLVNLNSYYTEEKIMEIIYGQTPQAPNIEGFTLVSSSYANTVPVTKAGTRYEYIYNRKEYLISVNHYQQDLNKEYELAEASYYPALYGQTLFVNDYINRAEGFFVNKSLTTDYLVDGKINIFNLYYIRKKYKYDVVIHEEDPNGINQYVKTISLFGLYNEEKQYFYPDLTEGFTQEALTFVIPANNNLVVDCYLKRQIYYYDIVIKKQTLALTYEEERSTHSARFGTIIICPYDIYGFHHTGKCDIPLVENNQVIPFYFDRDIHLININILKQDINGNYQQQTQVTQEALFGKVYSLTLDFKNYLGDGLFDADSNDSKNKRTVSENNQTITLKVGRKQYSYSIVATYKSLNGGRAIKNITNKAYYESPLDLNNLLTGFKGKALHTPILRSDNEIFYVSYERLRYALDVIILKQNTHGLYEEDKTLKHSFLYEEEVSLTSHFPTYIPKHFYDNGTKVKVEVAKPIKLYLGRNKYNYSLKIMQTDVTNKNYSFFETVSGNDYFGKVINTNTITYKGFYKEDGADNFIISANESLNNYELYYKRYLYPVIFSVTTEDINGEYKNDISYTQTFPYGFSIHHSDLKARRGFMPTMAQPHIVGASKDANIVPIVYKRNLYSVKINGVITSHRYESLFNTPLDKHVKNCLLKEEGQDLWQEVSLPIAVTNHCELRLNYYNKIIINLLRRDSDYDYYTVLDTDNLPAQITIYENDKGIYNVVKTADETNISNEVSSPTYTVYENYKGFILPYKPGEKWVNIIDANNQIDPQAIFTYLASKYGSMPEEIDLWPCFSLIDYSVDGAQPEYRIISIDYRKIDYKHNYKWVICERVFGLEDIEPDENDNTVWQLAILNFTFNNLYLARRSVEIIIDINADHAYESAYRFLSEIRGYHRYLTHPLSIINKSKTFITIDDCLYFIKKNEYHLLFVADNKITEEYHIPNITTHIAGSYLLGINNFKTLKVVMGDNVIALQKWYIFYNLYSCNEIVLSNNITEIPCYTFYESKELRYINMPTELLTISYNAFSYTGLKDVVLNKKLKTIANYAFVNMTLNSLTINANVDFFTLENLGLKDVLVINLDPKSKSFALDERGMLYSADFKKLVCVPQKAETAHLYFHEKTEEICSRALVNLKYNNLASITLPDNVKTIAPLGIYIQYWENRFGYRLLKTIEFNLSRNLKGFDYSSVIMENFFIEHLKITKNFAFFKPIKILCGGFSIDPENNFFTFDGHERRVLYTSDFSNAAYIVCRSLHNYELSKRKDNRILRLNDKTRYVSNIGQAVYHENINYQNYEPTFLAINFKAALFSSYDIYRFNNIELSINDYKIPAASCFIINNTYNENDYEHLKKQILGNWRLESIIFHPELNVNLKNKLINFLKTERPKVHVREDDGFWY